MSDFDVTPVGTRHFIEAIRQQAPNGEPVVVSFYPNGDWAVYGNGRFAQPCDEHEYIQSGCANCGKPAQPTASSHD